MTTPSLQTIQSREAHCLLPVFDRYPVALARGKGCYVWDVDGRRYLDMISGVGVTAFGHAHPRIVGTIRQQAARLVHVSNLHFHEYQGLLAERLARLSGLDRAFFTNSGTEAIEGAIKVVRAWGKRSDPPRTEIVALENSFHGRSLGALSVTGQAELRRDFEPLMPGVRFVPAEDGAALEAAVSERTAAIFIECVQGESGVRPVSEAFLAHAHRQARRAGALLVADEVQCGMGRTGSWFAYQGLRQPIQPDVVVTAKPLAAGLPLGVVLVSNAAASAMGPGSHGSTFGGGPLACRVALESLDLLEELLPQVAGKGSLLREEALKLQQDFPAIREVRASGLMVGLELNVPARDVVLEALRSGLLVNSVHGNVLRMLPPFVITPAQIEEGMRRLRRALTRAAAPAHRPARAQGPHRRLATENAPLRSQGPQSRTGR